MLVPILIGPTGGSTLLFTLRNKVSQSLSLWSPLLLQLIISTLSTLNTYCGIVALPFERTEYSNSGGGGHRCLSEVVLKFSSNRRPHYSIGTKENLFRALTRKW